VLPNRTEVATLRVTRGGARPLKDAPRPGTPLDILVSDNVARYWILDRPSGLASTAELDLYAADRFAAIFGDDPAAWTLRVDPAPRADRWLACAIPARFADDLPRSAAAQGWQVRQIQSRFISEFNRCCHALDEDTAFCVASTECTTIGLIVDGRWRSIRVHPPLSRTGASFGTLLQRDCAQAGIAVDSIRPVVVGSLRERAQWLD
jgi:hypothetical protein